MPWDIKKENVKKEKKRHIKTLKEKFCDDFWIEHKECIACNIVLPKEFGSEQEWNSYGALGIIYVPYKHEKNSGYGAESSRFYGEFFGVKHKIYEIDIDMNVLSTTFWNNHLNQMVMATFDLDCRVEGNVLL